jgi:hypothetical protein
MKVEKKIGSVVVTEKGSIVLLIETDVIVEDGQFPVGVFDKGIILRGTAPVGSRCMIQNGDGFRVVSHVGELVRLLEATGIDLITPAERPLSRLSPEERIARLEQENARLQASAAK